MAIANTVIQLKKSSTTGRTPVSLNVGETALNYADGKLFYLNSSGTVSYFYGQNNGPSFATANANGTLILTTVANDTLSFNPGNNIVITGNSTSKSVSITLSNNITVSGNITTGAGVGGNITGANNIYANTFIANSPTSTVYVTQSQLVQDTTNTYNHLYTLGLFSGNTDQSIQIGGQNFANTQNSSTDLALYNNLGTDTNNYIDMGITSAAYNVVLNNFTASQPGDGYLYANGSNLIIGTYTPGTNLKIFVGGYNSSNVVANFNAPNTASSSNTTGALTVRGGIAATGNVYANSIYTNGLYYAANGNPISTGGGSITLSDSISSNSSANAATSNAVYVAVSTALAFSIALG